MPTDYQYAQRDIVQLDEDGNYYIRHVSAMTAEGLHAKSDIAAELAWRDREIARLRDDAERYRYLKKVFEFACNAAPGLYDDDRHEPHRQSIAIDDAAIDEANEEDFGAALENGDE